MTSNDSDMTTGIYNTASLGYGQRGLFAVIEYDAVSPDFLPRLGFAPEVDYKGPSAFVEWSKPMTHGAVRQVSIAGGWVDYDRYNGGHYRDAIDGEANVLLSNGLGIGLSSHFEDFLGTKDHLYGASFRMPSGNPYRYYAAGVQWGRLEKHDFKGITFAAAYRPIEKIQLTASYQIVDHFEHEDLGILGMNYDLGKDTYLSGRLVKRSDDWGGYLSLRRSGNRGSEYFLILGDPNAQTFRSSLILKVIYPFETR
jgi:hypothetical protein